MPSSHHCPEISAALVLPDEERTVLATERRRNPARRAVWNSFEESWKTGRKIGAYTVISKIGHGGMGSVWLAERTDGEIQQKVAVKLPDVDHRRSGWRDRFLRERELLASLHHPSIVRVIDAGQTQSGRPYLAMEYVDGAAIDVYSAGISIRKRLELFLQVCEGVSHAHRRLVIHRDLKPSNILVDSTGQPKLLDFGIAKLLDETDGATQAADPLLTPKYASPEQLRGIPQTTAADIYSLGAVLYKLLTGRAPDESAYTPVSTSASLSSDIDYILRKALRDEPEERYESADAFADDIRALLESRPVAARSGDQWYRARKVLRRHWTPVAAAVLLLFSLTVGLYLANRERGIAQQRFQELRKVAKTFVFDLHDETAKLEGSTKAREMIVRTGLQYLDSLAKDAGGDLALQREIAAGYVKLGDAEGLPTSPNLGRVDEALANYRKAGDLYARIAAKDPAYLPDLARYYLKYAALVRFNHDLNRARELSESAIQSFDLMRASRPLDAQSAQSYIGAWCTLGDMEEDLGLYRKAWMDFSRCRELALARLKGVRDTQSLSNLAQADERVATAAQELGLLSAALRAFDEGQSVLDEILAAEPGNPKFQRRRTVLEYYRSKLYYTDTSAHFGDPARALVIARRYLQRAEAMVRSDPNDTSAQFSRAIAMFQVSFCLRESDAAAAVALARNSVRLFDDLVASRKGGYLIHSRRLRAMVRLGEAQLAAGQLRDALDSSESALSGVRPLAGKNAAESSEHIVLVSALILAGRTNAASGAAERAETLFHEAREEAKSIARDHELENLIQLANAEKALGDFYAQQRRNVEARACYQRLGGLWQDFGESNEYVDRQKASAARMLASVSDVRPGKR
ncbi:MAG: protein kinase [Bryobacteraceae bacterium]